MAISATVHVKPTFTTCMSDNQFAGKTVLIIEDDPFLLSMYVTKLEMAEYTVLQATDGKEGLDKVRSEKPDLVLLDVLLPEMDGFEVLEAIHQDTELNQIPVILLTNLGQKEDIDRGLELGAVDYLIKAHFTPQEVMKKIEAALAGKEEL